jgi:hypothetical protein
MLRASRFLQGVLVGAAIVSSLQILGQAGGAAAAVATQNGDINGDGNLDLSDAVSLLRFLFQGGPPPVAIDCGEPEPTAPQVRFLNDLTCNGGNTTARMEVCGSSTLSRVTNQAYEECQAVEASSACLVKLSGTAPCGSFAMCVELSIDPGVAYDFVLSVNGGAPSVFLFAQPLPGDGSCPPFPTPGTPPTQIIDGGCAGLGAGAAVDAGSWAGAGGW